MNRSAFIQTAGLALAGTSLGSVLTACGDTGRKEETVEPEVLPGRTFSAQPGMQLYTLRDALAADATACLDRVAAIGYKELELFDPVGISSMLPMLHDRGMFAVATHFLPGFVTGKWQTASQFMTPPEGVSGQHILEICAENGVGAAGVAVLFPEERNTLDDYRVFAQQFNSLGEQAKGMGVQLYYHNHSFEFQQIDGMFPFQVLMDHLDADLVKFELDVFWVQVSGEDPLPWIERLGKRLLAVHLKDLRPDTPVDVAMEVDPSAFLPLGQGMIDLPAVIRAARHAGAIFGFVEQDHHAGGDPFDNIATSLKYLQSLGL